MTYITSEDLADLDDTIEDEMEVDGYARAAARAASAKLLALLITHHGAGRAKRQSPARRTQPAKPHYPRPNGLGEARP